MPKRLGRQTVALDMPAVILSHAAVGGKMEGGGPLSDYFDFLSEDSFFGEKSWEKAESAMQKTALTLALEKGGFTAQELDYVQAVDQSRLVHGVEVVVDGCHGDARHFQLGKEKDLVCRQMAVGLLQNVQNQLALLGHDLALR